MDLAERIADALRAPVRVAGRDVAVKASIGIALSTPLQSRAASLMRDADTAMHQAKSAGKACYAIYGSGLNKLDIELLEAASDVMTRQECGVVLSASVGGARHG